MAEIKKLGAVVSSVITKEPPAKDDSAGKAIEAVNKTLEELKKILSERNKPAVFEIKRDSNGFISQIVKK